MDGNSILLWLCVGSAIVIVCIGADFIIGFIRSKRARKPTWEILHEAALRGIGDDLVAEIRQMLGALNPDLQRIGDFHYSVERIRVRHGMRSKEIERMVITIRFPDSVKNMIEMRSLSRGLIEPVIKEYLTSHQGAYVRLNILLHRAKAGQSTKIFEFESSTTPKRKRA